MPYQAVARVLPLAGPLVSQHLKVVIVHDQVVGDEEDGGLEGTVTETKEGAVGFIDLDALITRRTPSGPARKTFGVGIVLNKSGLARELGGTASPAGQAGRGRDGRGPGPVSRRTASPAGQAGRGQVKAPLMLQSRKTAHFRSGITAVPSPPPARGLRPQQVPGRHSIVAGQRHRTLGCYPAGIGR